MPGGSFWVETLGCFCWGQFFSAGGIFTEPQDRLLWRTILFINNRESKQWTIVWRLKSIVYQVRLKMFWGISLFVCLFVLFLLFCCCCWYICFFTSNTFISNARLKLPKNQAKAKQHPEFLPFENYLLSSSTLSANNNRRYSKKCTKNKYLCLYEVIWLMTMKMRLKMIDLGLDMNADVLNVKYVSV